MKTTVLLSFSLVAATLLSTACGGATDGPSTSESEDEIRAKKTLLCASSANEVVYFGQTSQLRLEANVSKDGVLANAALTMSADQKLGIRNETWDAQKKYAPSNKKYEGMQKYSSADAWCGYSVIAPRDLNGQAGKFSVYVQQACEGGFVSTATLSCKVESKDPVKPDAPTSASSVELRFSAAGKRDAIAAGSYKASAFQGNTIVIASSKTDIDLDNLVDSDSESAPDTVCYSGDVAGAKKILSAMLGNTDGNGDHFLDEGATITAGKSNALKVQYSVTGEGGSVPRSLTVSLCK